MKRFKSNPLFYISLAGFLFFSAVIIGEASTPSGLSGLQSNFLANIGAAFINSNTDPIKVTQVKPTSYTQTRDSSYLGNEDGVSKIAIGTTTLVSYEINYPKKDKKEDAYDYAYTLDYLNGKADYSTTLAATQNENKMTINLRVTASNLSNQTYKINFNVAETLQFQYSFKIVDLPAPTEFETRIGKTELKINETTQITTKFIGNDKDDYYLRRYFDETKILRKSSNPAVATVDEYGVVRAISSGQATISCGTNPNNSYLVTVNSQSVEIPEVTLSYLKDSSAKLNPTVLDYDYIFTEEDPNEYSMLVYPSFSSDLDNKDITWISSNPLVAKIAPYSYDEEGFPIYKDKTGNPCIRIAGYRKKGNATLTGILNANPNLKFEVEMTSEEALPTTMTLNKPTKTKISQNDQIVLSASFGPKNVNNKAIHVSDPDSFFAISNNDSDSVTLTAKKDGNPTIDVNSIANPSLKDSFSIEISTKQAINEDNYKEFHLSFRKFIGHFMLFFVTAIFGTMFFYTLVNRLKGTWLVALLSSASGLFLASLSEFIQIFIPKRGPALQDVGIDFFGYIIGTALTIGCIFLIYFIIKKVKQHKENN